MTIVYVLPVNANDHFGMFSTLNFSFHWITIHQLEPSFCVRKFKIAVVVVVKVQSPFYIRLPRSNKQFSLITVPRLAQQKEQKYNK